MSPVTDLPWWARAVVYQIWPRSFADSDADGIGDLRGILEHLDHLVDLGVDAVWLSPVYVSPWDDGGYDISDYTDVDPTFGTLADLDRLIEALHERGLRLVLDLVVNHTSDEHPWFVESRSSRDNPKRDWYWWRPARPGTVPGEPGSQPTNWRSFFSTSAWDYDETTGEYYLHLFSRRQPDLNWENPQVRQAVYAMMRWWLDRGVDGFRMDVINMVSKDPALPDGWAPPGEALGFGFEHFLNGPRIHEFLAEMHAAVAAGRDGRLLLIGEMPGVMVEQARLYTDPARGEVDMVFAFDHVGLGCGPGGKYDPVPFTLVDLKRVFGSWQAGLADVGWNSLYWDNHDQPRAVSRFGSDGEHRVRSAKALATLLHLHRGTPFVYQGEELGMTNAGFERIEDFIDIEGRSWAATALAAGQPAAGVLAALQQRARDNARTPMQWDAGPNAGFTTGVPWLPVNPNHVQVNAAAQRDDPTSVLTHYRRLADLRHAEPAVVSGSFTMLLPDHQQVYAYTRRLGRTELLVLVNVSDEPAWAAVPDAPAWETAEVVLGGPDPALAAVPPGEGVGLQPWENRVLRRRLPPDPVDGQKHVGA
jgi:oligo-1,6-glucosidase